MNPVTMRTRLNVLAAVLVVASACGEPGRVPAPNIPPYRSFDQKTRILRVRQGDEEMNAAIDRARSTLPHLVQRLTHAPAGMTYLGVKVRLARSDGPAEFIWLEDVTYADGKIAGKLTEDAELFPEFRVGDPVRVEPGQITDWMTVENGRACGGFTQRIVMAEAGAKVLAAYLAEMGIPRLPLGDVVCDSGPTGSER
ncbi:MAG TPA: DUF2314 domain-containing protein [Longimicrobium sp.]|jgi:uncharacterized protein YegJ (DUF2314 family)|uniref:DUF2314 domain-containing protein n=1 Tax=Longimicrobium sp. TaxID=2029185 RepID=UPI002EDAEF3F